MKNYKRRNWGKGPLIETVLGAVKIPRFVVNTEMNKGKIFGFMKQFNKASLSNFNLSSLELELSEMEENVDSIVFDLYGLTEEQCSYVNLFIEQQKELISKTI